MNTIRRQTVGCDSFACSESVAMSPGAYRALAADYAFGAYRLLSAAQQNAEAGGLEVNARHIVEGVALLADQLLAATDEYGRTAAYPAGRGSCNLDPPENRIWSA